MTEKWSAEKANEWYAKQPWFAGCNFIPSTAVNQIEMWRGESFDEQTIDRELALAEGLGMNAVRVYLHDLVWEEDPDGFKSRITRFLDLADARGIRALIVFFDDCWQPEPRGGVQPEPVPGVHNSRWVNSPGVSAASDPAQEPRLKAYVQDITGHFAEDERIIAWDVYNELGNVFLPTLALPLIHRIPRLAVKFIKFRFISIPTRRLFRKAVAWIREMNPSQPLTASVYINHPSLNRELLEASDIISFHNYETSKSLERQIGRLKKLGRPVFCTEYLNREEGSLFQTFMPVFKREKIACFNWGLVAGKTQTVNPWKKPGDGSEPALWFHDIYRPDGTPFSRDEVDFIRRMTGKSQSL